MRKNIVIGVDPGLSGAVALFNGVSGELRLIDMPVVEYKKGKRRVDLTSLGIWLNSQELETIRVAYIEDVHSMPQQGVASTFAFGRAFGGIEGVIGGAGVPIIYTPPTVWKARMGVTADKETSRARATHILPKYADKWNLKKHDGRAEATLIAIYGYTLEMPKMITEAKNENERTRQSNNSKQN